MQNLYHYVIIPINDKYTIKLIFLTKIEYNFLYKDFLSIFIVKEEI